jgi:sugar lactone lactonase YvrE
MDMGGPVPLNRRRPLPGFVQGPLLAAEVLDYCNHLAHDQSKPHQDQQQPPNEASDDFPELRQDDAGPVPSRRWSPQACATSAEGIAAGRGATFYAGDLFAGDIFRGNLQRGTAELFIDAPTGRMAVGMAVNVAHDLLFVAGGFTGQAYIYDTVTGATVASYQFGDPAASLINDVALTRDGAWFTDSFQARLYFVPVSRAGVPGPTFRTLGLSGPAAALSPISGAVNLNGIAATPNGTTLIVAHSANAQLDTVDPTSGASAAIAGVSVPNVDGILLEAGRLWAVQNFSNQVSRIRLAPDLSSGLVEEVITSPLFQIPTTAARFGSRLAVVNAKFDTGIPPTATQFEVVLVDR